MRFIVKALVISSLALGGTGIFPAAVSAYDQPVTKSAGYVARDEGVKGVFDALSTVLKKPVILSKLAARKKISGNFDLGQPQDTLADLTEQLSLIWYNDGQAIYIYDASELRSMVIVLRNTSFPVVQDFLKQSGLYDARYPLRSDRRNATFYVSGPPIYVETVANTARFLDEKSDGFDGRETVAVIPLYHAFVQDRHYKYRNDDIVIPGIARVVKELLVASSPGGEVRAYAAQAPVADAGSTDQTKMPITSSLAALKTAIASRPSGLGFSIVANPGNNSLLVRGSAGQVEYVRNLVAVLDEPKRHIELSVWIVDLQKEKLEQLGAEWAGSINFGDKLGFSFNGNTGTTIDGAKFMASVLALSKNNQANIVSRPMILTQENIPAIFDNNRTFYTKLVGERTAELQDVTYGTSVSVLPRFTAADEIEMMINVEDGNEEENEKITAEGLPEVGRTNISTIARVPRGKSLLIGGYTRNESTKNLGKIPGLGDLPLVGGLFRYKSDRQSNLVRVFFIQPREIDSPLAPDANEMINRLNKDLNAPQLQDWISNYIDNRTWLPQ